ncbi:MAG: peptide chain release factor N(5)-glutamine methyltransferase [Alphaproteobacteria bacterium]|nr:peptide chain release factor N(5)-glutamine methyltransferase [Alphaproteobacteria bacterium]
MSLKEIFAYYSSKLQNDLETRLILQHVLGIDSNAFIINPNLEITKQAALEEIFSKRIQGVPLAYLLNQEFFWKHNFYVNENVLIPRQDSETLITAFLEYIPANAEINILEIGIGSGCLLLSLLHEYQNAIGQGVDISAEALNVSLINAKNLQVASRLKLSQSNIFSSVKDSFDIIISNPPYIAENDPDIARDVRNFEPSIALFAANNGLFFYEEILSQAQKYLKKDGMIFLEIGYKQNADVISIAKSNGLQYLETKKDMSRRDRVVILKKA